MEYLTQFKKVAVLGAAGKMGSGILLLTAMEMTDQWLRDKNLQMELFAVDLSYDVLRGVVKYLKSQITKAAEKKTVWLRSVYEDREDLIENGEIIRQYVDDVLNRVTYTTHLSDIYNASLIFEAIKEDPKVKTEVLGMISKNSTQKPWFFTNTSSIPISFLDREARLQGKIIGFHFYNPPAVQKLVELIQGEQTESGLVEFARTFAKQLRKVVVPSNDKAGFIGNGHFMRDALFGLEQAQDLTDELTPSQAIWAVNRVTQDFLLRPMGIFQLIDYVGIDVVQYILEVMAPYFPDEQLMHEWLNRMLESGIRGGQFADGSQREGFLKYQKGRPVGVYDWETQTYLSVDDLATVVDPFLGSLPEPLNWKTVNFSSNKKEQLDRFFKQLATMDSKGALLAKAYGLQSKKIGIHLVDGGVAKQIEDVNRVLETGFYHAYGPVNEYFND